MVLLEVPALFFISTVFSLFYLLPLKATKKNIQQNIHPVKSNSDPREGSQVILDT